MTKKAMMTLIMTAVSADGSQYYRLALSSNTRILRAGPRNT